ncbi:hypothetical protein [Brevibacillus sp. AY1]|uniref:hypothetical protein n=1 Tax=Brevibacillus sp. AY1 TaxID=2807621 RepID=UPI0024562470|nr:hypothetical protein [Brevibacillus sp. AY1]MDH4619903.1 hypothetical protein [Brevibacillus sp. AY1]
MDNYTGRVLLEDNLVYSFFGDYNIVIAKEQIYSWMGNNPSDSLYYVLIEKDLAPNTQQVMHLKVFTTIGLTLKYLSAMLPEYIYDLALIDRIKENTNQLAFKEKSKD